jgi:hypothetical protein
LARLARQRAEWQGFAGMVRKACPGLARVGAAGMARSGRNGQAGRAWQAWQARCGAARSGQAMQAWPGTMMRDPVRLGKARQARCGEIWTGRARQAWLRRHGLARPVLAGKAWSSVEGQARLARCGRARARHGWQGLVGTSGGAWQAKQQGHGWVWCGRVLQASLGAEGQVRQARQWWQGRDRTGRRGTTWR